MIAAPARYKKLAGAAGFEPATCGFGVRRRVCPAVTLNTIAPHVISDI
jgi:hypothetical protein